MSYYNLSFQAAVDHQPRPVAIIRVDPLEPVPRKAVAALLAGGLLVLPFAGGYLVACSAADEAAVRRLSEVTGVAAADLQYVAASAEQASRAPRRARLAGDTVPAALMRAADVPLAVAPCGPGRPPAPTAQHVVFVLGDRIDLVLDAGRAESRVSAAVR